MLGASGDLAGRFLYPALVRLHESGLLGDTEIIGVTRGEMSDDDYRSMVRERLDEHAPKTPDETVRAFGERLGHHTADVTDPERLGALFDRLDGPAVVYLALPNSIFLEVVQALRERRPPEGSKLVVEKPFGEDLEDARRLNAAIHEAFDESDVFRIDHFLAKQTVLNILGLRFANRVIEPLWNNAHVEAVDIVWDETITLEGRASYYDSAGALKDMLQNHLLQLLALIAINPPVGIGQRDLRNAKVDALRAVRPADPGPSRRARYTAGDIEGRRVPDYSQEEGVDPERGTETFAEATLWVDNWRWAGVPFRLRTGKALGKARKELVLRFRPAPHQPFPEAAPPNELRMILGPDEISLDVNLNGAGDPFGLERARLNAEFPQQELPAYSRLIQSILEGDQTLSIRGDEAEECWRIFEPVLRAWKDGDVPLESYPAGSSGPDDA
ncbi:glucose-6-phosphate dehydrogenase [Glycomyces halotolerans]